MLLTAQRDATSTRALLALGALAGPVYVTVSLAQALTRDGFELHRHAWSQLANGSLGWLQVANLIGSGVLVVAGAAGLRRTPDAGTWAPRLLSGYGAGMIVAGLFRADPGRGFPPGTPEVVATSWQGTVHFAAAGLGFVALAAACVALGRRYAARAERHRAAVSHVTGALFVASFAALAGGGGSAWTILAFVGAMLLASAWLTAIMLDARP